jgi:hypothetical protein
MIGRRQRPRTRRPEVRVAPDTRRPRPSRQLIERRNAHALRVFTQTAIVSAVLGGIFLLTSSHTLHSMALFLIAWAAGWAAASLYLFVRRLVNGDRRSGKS